MVTQPSFLTAVSILDHPAFARGRDRHIDAVLALYERKPPMIELMLDGGRIMVYAAVMAMWGRHRADDAGSLPTVTRLKRTVGLFQVASPRQIDHILARFAQVGHLQVTTAADDLRVHVVLPTATLIEHDRAFIRAHYLVLAELYGDAAYALPLARDVAFLKAMRGAWITTLETMAQEIFIENPAIRRFYASSAGMLMLMKLVRLQAESPDGWVALDLTDFGRRFAVSRTHVRTLLKAAAADRLVALDARGSVQLSPALLAAFDRNVAGRMSLLDRAHRAALGSLADTGRP